jgi:hypothetical protein
VPAPNRVTPTGEVVAIAQRGLFLGNRGCIHDAPRHLARRWQVRRWITCALRYKDWRAPTWEPRRWTPLFFWDEAVALAAGHRPCALCRHRDYVAWQDAWAAATGQRPGADGMDRRLHADRLDGRAQRRHTRPWPALPTGAFVELPLAGTVGRAVAPARLPVPALVVGDRLVPWSPAGYGLPRDRPARGEATVLTPAVTVDLLARGYAPRLHPSAPLGT